MSKKQPNPKFSESISDILRMMDDAVKDYSWHESQISVMDRMTQDYLHSLELNDLDYKERAKIATKLSKCCQERRIHKDMVDNLLPLVTFLTSDKGKQMTNTMRETLGKTRKIENYMETRRYYPRVLNEPVIYAKDN